jgi:hypothetical protein
VRSLARVVNLASRYAQAHPRVVVVGWVAVVVGLAGLAVASAISLVLQPAPWKLFMFAATWLATWVAIASRQP